MKNDKITAFCTGIFLFLLAGLFSIAIISGVLDFGTEEGFLYEFGSFITGAYGICSILIPVFLLTAGVFCFMEKWSVQRACILFISVIPFFTLVFAEKICRKTIDGDFNPISFFKIVVTLIVAILLVATEYLLAVVLAGKFHDRLSGINFPFTKKDDEDESSAEEKIEASEDYEDDISAEETDKSKRLTEEKYEIPAENEKSGDDSSEDVVTDDFTSILTKNRKEIEKITSESEKPSNRYESIWSIDENGEFKNETPDQESAERAAEAVKEDNEEEVLFSEAEDNAENEPAPEREDVNRPRKIVLDDEESENEGPVFNLSAPENINVVDLQNLNNEDEESEDDIIAQFERENQKLESAEENPFEDEESQKDEYVSEIPFDEFDEESAPERQDTPVENLMANFDSLIDEAVEPPEAEEAVIVDVEEAEVVEDDDIEDGFNVEVEGESSFGEIEEPAIEEESAVFTEENSEDEPHEPTEEELFGEAPAEDFSADDSEVQKKTSDLEHEGKHSIFSSLDSVFNKMDEDAKAEVNNNKIDPTAPAILDSNGNLKSADVDMKKTAVVTDEKGNTVPVKVTPKIRRRAYKISTDLLTEYEENRYWEIDDETRQASSNLMATLKEFNIDANVTEIRKGPVVTMIEMLPAPGVKLSKIQALQDNIALRLAAKSVRIVAPIPGKRAVGIEVPNKNRAIVSFRECIEQNRSEWKKMAVPVVLGKDIEGETQLMDLVKTPHLLIAGSTGAGKSVCVNSMILSILFKRSPNDVKMILIDPKIVELSLYNGIGHLLTPVITEPKMAMQALQYCLCEMERRYAVLKGMGCRDIKSYNQKIEEQHIATEKLPYIVVVIDEFADLMATTGKQLESAVSRLAAKARAIGIHLVLATQRPSVDVITGLIKANIPSRIAFSVSSKMDSRIIIDQMGADKLLGKGDMLYASSTDPFPIRIQGAFVSDQEVENVVNEVKNCWGEPEYIDDEIFVEDEEDGSDGQMSLFGEAGDDPLYEKALDIVIQAGKASASYIQRRLSIGYNRAARLVEEMEERGIVGPANGSKPREIIHMP